MDERSNNVGTVRNTPIWNEVYKIVDQLDLADCAGCDSVDKPSVTHDLIEMVKGLLDEQKHICQTEFDKRSFHDGDIWYVACDDILGASYPDRCRVIEDNDVKLCSGVIHHACKHFDRVGMGCIGCKIGKFERRDI